MPRAKLPEYFKEYEIKISTCEGTVLMTQRFHEEKISYHKRWIKGTLLNEELDGEGTCYLATTLTYVKGRFDGQVGQEDEYGEEAEQTELPS